MRVPKLSILLALILTYLGAGIIASTLSDTTTLGQFIFESRADKVRQFPGQIISGVVPTKTGVYTIESRRVPGGLDHTGYWVGPGDTEGTCDDTASCKVRCSGMCKAAGHGEEVCNVQVAQRDNGRSCSADCGACGVSADAVCIVECRGSTR